MKNKFMNIAKLTRDSRLVLGISQQTACSRMGYKNGQFVSNIERGICSIPIKDINKFSSALAVSPDKIIEAIVMDFKENICSKSMRV